MWSRSTWAAALALALLACAQPDETPVQPPPPVATTPPTSIRVDKPIAWPADSERDREALAALPSEAAAAIGHAPLPVLVVKRAGLLTNATIIAKPNWYALSARHDGVTVSLHATKVAHRYPHIGPASGNRRVRGQAAFVTQNAGIWSAAWLEGGAAYALEVECATLPDPRCDDERFVLELASELSYVGGARP